MQFIVIAYDYKDEGALARRLDVREAHLKFAGEMFESGKWLYAAALLNDDGKMNGSVIVCDYPSEEILRKEWLDNEAYITGKVWEDVTIRKVQIAPHCLPK
ncbi:MAG: YciI family protein [Melioribacteraceae bacterium]|nr:YciI family protein [Melioribacteraceae bacterium]MCF8356426.1 YciI family protein [Melioribacteraceae bacterium]MCF8395781.1 YciI family protein [Melioribacteraceae bacterium]MCF8420910.1 YciI family protein [Melioribacteraceae bacterium]